MRTSTLVGVALIVVGADVATRGGVQRAAHGAYRETRKPRSRLIFAGVLLDIAERVLEESR